MQLPIVKINGRRWFYDARLRQLRDTRNPHKFIDNVDEIALLLAIRAAARQEIPATPSTRE